MKPSNNKIIVSSDIQQKGKAIIAGVEVLIPINFEVNYREKSPVIAQVVNGNDAINEGDILLCHHNTFYYPSPYHLYDNLFSIPANGNIIFCKLNIHDGSLFPVLGNMLCDKVDIEIDLPLPPSQRKQYTDRIVITNSGYTNYKNGQLIFTRPSAAYQIVYKWSGELKRVYKCYDQQVCGVLVDENN